MTTDKNEAVAPQSEAPEEKPAIIDPPETSTEESPVFNITQKAHINRLFGVDNNQLADTIRRILRDAPGLAETSLGPPTGSIVQWSTDTAPTGWILCDGTAQDATADTTLQTLFDLIGTTYGGADNSDYKVPDMRGRFPLGKDNMGGSSANRVTDAQADSLGGSGGAETKDISHTHTGTTAGDGAFNTNVSGTASGSRNQPEHTHTFTTGSGGSASQNIMPPFLTLNYIIKK